MLSYAGPRPDYPNGWYPIAPLNLSKTDTSLIFVAANAIQYEQPVFDPLYQANMSFAVNDKTWVSAFISMMFSRLRGVLEVVRTLGCDLAFNSAA